MGKPLRVLIIEDSEEDTQLFVRELQQRGYEVEFERVETAEAMQLALIQKSWNLILSDYILPKFDAPYAVELLNASGLDVPLIIISSTANYGRPNHAATANGLRTRNPLKTCKPPPPPSPPVRYRSLARVFRFRGIPRRESQAGAGLIEAK